MKSELILSIVLMLMAVQVDAQNQNYDYQKNKGQLIAELKVTKAKFKECLAAIYSDHTYYGLLNYGSASYNYGLHKGATVLYALKNDIAGYSSEMQQAADAQALETRIEANIKSKCAN